MVTDFLLGLLSTLIDWLLGLLPSWSVHLPDGLQNYVSMLKYFDDWLPVTEILHCIALTVTLFGGMNIYKWTVKLIDWVADVLP